MYSSCSLRTYATPLAFPAFDGAHRAALPSMHQAACATPHERWCAMVPHTSVRAHRCVARRGSSESTIHPRCRARSAAAHPGEVPGASASRDVVLVSLMHLVE